MTADLEELYRRHRQGFFTLALAVTGRRDLAEDAVQEAIVRLLRSQKTPADPVPYAFTAVRNAARDLLRKHRDRSEQDRERAGIFARAPGEPAAALGAQERETGVRAAIRALPADQAETLVLRIYAGLSFQQIATTLNEPLSTVSSRYRRTLGRLKGEVEKYV